MNDLIQSLFVATFDTAELRAAHDGAVLPKPNARLAFTTDSYVVQPLFFPGGDIGSLAIHGTVNDLAMCGAEPRWLSVGFILEEGLPMETLRRIVQSMQDAAGRAAVRVVTGDTKVVERGSGDGVFINTAGVGVLAQDLAIGPRQIQPDDKILLSGDIGRHGIAVLAAREGLEFERVVESDSAPVASAVQKLIEAGVKIHCLRDLTRGGLASALVEISETARRSIRIEEDAIPVQKEVRGGCEILGFDPLYVANEGRFVAFVPSSQTDLALEVLRTDPVSRDAIEIGEVTGEPTALVTMTTCMGTRRIIDRISGEQLPRIC